MMAERTLVTVTDCDLFKLPEDQRGKLIALLEDFPEYCCLVFIYDIVEYKPNKTYKKLCDAISKAAQTVKFEAQEKGDLINWIFRRFKATGHDISAAAAEHLPLGALRRLPLRLLHPVRVAPGAHRALRAERAGRGQFLPRRGA